MHIFYWTSSNLLQQNQLSCLNLWVLPQLGMAVTESWMLQLTSDSVLGFCIFAFLHFCIFVFLYFCIFVFLQFCIFLFLNFCIFFLLFQSVALVGDGSSSRSWDATVDLRWETLMGWSGDSLFTKKMTIYIVLKSKHKWLEIFDIKVILSWNSHLWFIYILEETDISIETQDFRHGQQLNGFSRASQSYSRR